MYNFDVLVIGSGAAGLTLALKLPKTVTVAVLAKNSSSEGNTMYAQGGIAAVLDEANDSVESHIQDTINAGDGLCDRESVEFTVTHGSEAINWLIEQGVVFSAEEESEKKHHLTKEGGHSHRRVFHTADATGKAIQTTLLHQVQAEPNITIFEHRVAVDLITDAEKTKIIGCYALNTKNNSSGYGMVETFQANHVALATGGASKAYLYTSNPDIATGDGIAIAWRAGCCVANMEFIQFHPTCLYHPHAKSFLVTEAIRGEGGKLLLPDGERFMQRFDKRGELAPRDIVARAIDHEIKRLGVDCLYLDISYKPAEFITTHFPTIYSRCLEFGLDITQEPIPIVPAAHYTCGGVKTDLDGATDLTGLYAVGEVAHTGLHGANRMASNSLLECLVFADSAAQAISKTILNSAENGQPVNNEPQTIPEWDESRVEDSVEEVMISHNWAELRHFMWNYVGIVRTTKRLERAKRRVELLQHEIAEYYSHFRVSNDLLELRNLVTVAELIINSAMQRHESRGLHYTLDYPKKSTEIKDTVLTP